MTYGSGRAEKESKSMYRIKITLHSDLCAASGDGFAAAIDTDVCTDKYGFPVIPARRLKGCLRKAAEYICLDKSIIDGIFGISGNSESGSLKLSDAVFKNYEELTSEAVQLHVRPSEITSLFTVIKSATAIDNESGHALDSSLRFTRTVNHYFPFEDEKGERSETVFYADAEIDEKYKSDMEKICKALRNIGYKRTRGYGAVRCRLVSADKKYEQVLPLAEDKDAVYRLVYTVKLCDSLMLPSSGDISADLISGTAVNGAFAAKYLKDHSADAAFEELFLCDKVKFLPLYVTEKSGDITLPVPSFIGKIKGEKNNVNLIKYEKDTSPDKKIAKPYKTGYINSFGITEPLTETVYHHSDNEKSKILYTQTCLSKGQLFSGQIIGSGKLLNELIPIINEGRINFGRSKTAQYSHCEIVSAKAEKYTPSKVKLTKGKYYAAVAASDILTADEYGNYVPTAESIKKALSESAPGFVFDDDDNVKSYSIVKYRTVTGFNSKHGLQKAHIRAAAAGTTLIFTVNEDISADKDIYIGEKQNEGFGHIVILSADEFDGVMGRALPTAGSVKSGALHKLVNENGRIEKMRMSALDYASENKNMLIKLNSSTVGRLTLMAKESGSYSDLESRINSIKNLGKRRDALRILKDSNTNSTELRAGDLWKDYFLIILKTAKYMIKSEKGGSE
jgi:hypothetical protein